MSRRYFQGGRLAWQAEALESRYLLAVLIVDSLADQIVDDGSVTLVEAIRAANLDIVADAVEGVQRGDGEDIIRFAPHLQGQSVWLSGSTVISDHLAIEGIPGPYDERMSVGGRFEVTSGSSNPLRFALRDLRWSSYIDSDGQVTLERVDSPRVNGTGQLEATDVYGRVNVLGRSRQVTITGLRPIPGSSLPNWINFRGLDGAHVSIRDSTITGDGTPLSFGVTGVVQNGVLTIDGTTITHHSGGAFLGVAGSQVNISNSTFASNGSDQHLSYYGGLRLSGFPEADLTITNSTFTDNVGRDGGALLAVLGSGTLRIEHSTLVNNRARVQGAGGLSYMAAEVSVQNSILSGNVVDGDPRDLGTSLRDAPNFRHNFVGYTSNLSLLANVQGQGNIIGSPSTGPLNARLGPLADNGGPTPTHALLPLSPAVNAGSPDFVPPPDYDQRGLGFARVVGGRLDMGAYEFQASEGDFVADGRLDCADVDALVAAIAGGSSDLSFDLTGDGQINVADLDAWIGDIYGTLPGDANLDGVVDVADFNLWNANKFTATPAWCAGDFNADGVVDVADFNLWNAVKFTVAPSLPTFLAASPASQPEEVVPDDAPLRLDPTSPLPSERVGVWARQRDAALRALYATGEVLDADKAHEHLDLDSDEAELVAWS